MIYEPIKKEFEIPLSKNDLASILRVSIRTIDRDIKAGRLNCLKIGNGTIRFYEHHINEYLGLFDSEKTQMAANS